MTRTTEFDQDAALDRAMHLFWRQGYEATSIQDLVEHMGIGRGSLYNTFGDKHALYLAALDWYCATVGAGFLAPLDEPLPVRAALRRVFDNVVAESLAEGHHGCLMANSTLELASHDSTVRCRAAANLEGLEERIGRVLAHAQQEGEIGAHHDPRAVARFLFNALQGMRVTAKVTSDRAVLEDIARVTLSVLG